ncbi:MAG: hypothetical protein MUF53_04090, partial [Gemmatimonadaceae bacterium]|nr:hypothetical protein [Gemmatimonadaceae bacterium]
MLATLATLLLPGIASSLAAQVPVRPAAVDTVADSLAALADRVARTEEQLRMLRQQLAQVAREKVGAPSRAGLELSGRVLMNAFHTDGRANLVDVPTIALPAPAGPAPDPDALRGALGGT